MSEPWGVQMSMVLSIFLDFADWLILYYHRGNIAVRLIFCST